MTDPILQIIDLIALLNRQIGILTLMVVTTDVGLIVTFAMAAAALHRTRIRH